ncbi:hypothetical protein AAIH51_34495, partial [Pseudomonas aeruginosa]
EQLVLFEVESTHRLGLASAEEDGRHFARATRALAFFNGLLVPVKDRSQHNGRGKRKNERGGESKKSAASESALRRIQSSKQVTQKKPSMGLASTHRQYLDIMKNDDI